MATIANLAISLSADTKPLTRGLADAQGQLKGFGGSLGSLGSLASKGAAALGAVATAAAGAVAGAMSVAAAIAKVRQSFVDLDALAKGADMLGMSPSDLRAFQHAAELSGVEVNTLQQSMLKFGKTLGEAKDKGGPAADMLGRLGLNARTLAGMELADAFTATAERIGELETATERAQAAAAIFGEEGLKMLPLFKDSAAAISESQEKMKRFNMELSRGDLARIEGMNDAWSDLMLLVDGIADRFAVELAPSLQALIESSIDLLTPTKGIGAVWEEVGQWIEWAAGQAADNLAIMVGGLRSAASLASGMWVGFELSMTKARKKWEEWFGSGETGEFNKRIAELQAQWDFLSESFTRGMEDIGRGLSGEAGEAVRKRARELREAAAGVTVDTAGAGLAALGDMSMDVGKGIGRAAAFELKNATDAFNKLSTPGLERGSAGAASAIADAQIKSLVPTAKGMAELKQGQVIHIEIAKEQLQAIKELQRKNAIEQGRL